MPLEPNFLAKLKKWLPMATLVVSICAILYSLRLIIQFASFVEAGGPDRDRWREHFYTSMLFSPAQFLGSSPA